MTADPRQPDEPKTLQDPLAEAMRVVDLASERGLLVRLMGGMAIRAHAPDWPARTRRVEVDLDFATRSKDRGAFYHLLEAEGYTPDKRHNALFGSKQAYFVDVPRKPSRRRPRRLARDGPQLRVRRPARASRARRWPLAELLLSKLQIVKINRKDVLDALVLLAEHPLASDDGAPDSRDGLGAINVPRILSFTSNDWGWWRTVTGNLDVLDQYLAVELTPEDLDLNNGRAVLFDPQDPDRGAAHGHQRRTEVDPLEAPLEGRRAADLVPRSRRDGPRGSMSGPRRPPSAGAHEGLLRDRHPRLGGVLAQVPQRRQVPQGRRPDHGRRHDRQGDGPDRRQRRAAGSSSSRGSATRSRPRTRSRRWRSGSATAATTRSA